MMDKARTGMVSTVTIRVERSKYKTLRHETINTGVSFNSLVNRLLDQHLNNKRGGTFEATVQPASNRKMS